MFKAKTDSILTFATIFVYNCAFDFARSVRHVSAFLFNVVSFYNKFLVFHETLIVPIYIYEMLFGVHVSSHVKNKRQM